MSYLAEAVALSLRNVPEMGFDLANMASHGNNQWSGGTSCHNMWDVLVDPCSTPKGGCCLPQEYLDPLLCCLPPERLDTLRCCMMFAIMHVPQAL